MSAMKPPWRLIFGLLPGKFLDSACRLTYETEEEKEIGGTMKKIVVILLCLLSHATLAASSESIVSKGQTVYVPVYSNIFSAPKKIPFNLATILSIRNTDMRHSIRITGADYYDTKGKLLRRYYPQPLTLGPLESTDIYIPEDDTAGGTGANFIVNWDARKPVNAPVIESIMIGMKSGQGISFVSPGRELRNTAR